MATDWTNRNKVALFHAVYHATERMARREFVPINSVGSGTFLKRNTAATGQYGVQFVRVPPGAPRIIDPASVRAATFIRDATNDRNRFTGIAPNQQLLLQGLQQQPLVVSRGGLYTSEDSMGLLAETMQYFSPAFPKDATGALLPNVPPIDVVSPRCFIRMRVGRELQVADLDLESREGLKFLLELGTDKKVDQALKALNFSSLIEAIRADDYAASRALGLGLMSNPDIDGMRIGSAREFTTADVANETGTNIILFDKDQAPASSVTVRSMDIVERSVATGQLQSTHYTPDGSGNMTESGSTRLP